MSGWTSLWELRIQVAPWTPLAPLDDTYFVRMASLAFLLGQLRRLGPVDMSRKIRSRLAERGRNDRCVAVGRGRVLEVGANVMKVAGAQKFASWHHVNLTAVERVVLHKGLCRATLIWRTDLKPTRSVRL